MLFLDVNICLHALFHDATDEARGVTAWLDGTLSRAEPVAVSEQVVSSMIRIGTNHRAYPDPVTPEQSLAFAEALLTAPGAVRVRPGPRHWSLFAGLVRRYDLRANHVPDAYLAAMALEQGATFVTRDRGFRRFDQLKVLDPLA